MKTGDSRYRHRSLWIGASAALVVAGCLGDNYPVELKPPIEPLTTATATIENQLPIDGCSYPVTIDRVRYAPDAYSLAAIIARELPRVATVVIRYRPTGNTGFVRCDAIKRELPEIAFLFVD